MLRRVVLFLGAVLCAASLSAAVCYNPEARGLRVSRFQLDTLTSPWLSAPMDFSADPWALSGSEMLDLSRPEVFTAYSKRYGPRTACAGGLASRPECDGHVFKRFAGPGNEVRSLIADALAWWFATQPGALGGPSTCKGNGVPSEREITDAQATNDGALWLEFHARALPGGNEQSAIDVCRTDKPPGLFSEADPFWGWTNFQRNTCGPKPAPTPPVTPAPAPVVVACETPPADVLAAAKRVQALSSAKVAGQKVLDWLAAQSKRCSGPK